MSIVRPAHATPVTARTTIIEQEKLRMSSSTVIEGVRPAQGSRPHDAFAKSRGKFGMLGRP
jgi:hypothetical protein